MWGQSRVALSYGLLSVIVISVFPRFNVLYSLGAHCSGLTVLALRAIQRSWFGSGHVEKCGFPLSQPTFPCILLAAWPHDLVLKEEISFWMLPRLPIIYRESRHFSRLELKGVHQECITEHLIYWKLNWMRKFVQPFDFLNMLVNLALGYS